MNHLANLQKNAAYLCVCVHIIIYIHICSFIFIPHTNAYIYVFYTYHWSHDWFNVTLWWSCIKPQRSESQSTHLQCLSDPKDACTWYAIRFTDETSGCILSLGNIGRFLVQSHKKMQVPQFRGITFLTEDHSFIQNGPLALAPPSKPLLGLGDLGREIFKDR